MPATTTRLSASLPRRARRTATLLALALAAACGDGPTGIGSTPGTPGTGTPGTGTPGTGGQTRAPVASVALVPMGPELLVRGSRQVAVEVRAADGTLLRDRAVTWESSDPAIAIVQSNGTVFGAAEGTARIRATSEGVSTELTVTVGPVRVTRIEVRAYQLHVTAGQLVFPAVELYAADGRIVTDRPSTLTIGDETVVRRDAEGRLVAARPGFTTLTLAVDGQVARLGVFVQAHPVTGRWALRVDDLAGGGTRCTVSGLVVTIAADGRTTTFTPSAGGVRSGCEITGGSPPYATPAMPLLEATTWRNGHEVTVRTDNAGWALLGTMDENGRTITGTAQVADEPQGEMDEATGLFPPVRIRSGRFVLTRLD